MPLCILRTNLARAAFEEGFHATFSKFVADVLHKPLEKITVVLESGVDISRGGSTEPSVWLSIESINVFSAEKNPQIGESLRTHLKGLINVPEDRIIITLRDLPKEDLA